MRDGGRELIPGDFRPGFRRVFARWLRELAPDVAHVQHTVGLSTGVFDVLADAGVPTLFTLHDFCSTARAGSASRRAITCARRSSLGAAPPASARGASRGPASG